MEKGSLIKFIGKGDGVLDKGTHIVGEFSDYTLCGITLDGDEGTSGDYVSAEKLTCKNCRKIIKFCKKLDY